MSNSIKISVIVPIYNEETYLEECLNSILAQTLQEIEILCIDDGSTDCSLEILHSYAAKDSRIKVFTQKNRYAGTARNVGIKYAKGKYLSFLDADDFFSPFLLERLYKAAEKQGSDIVMCNAYEYNCMTGDTYKRNVWEEKEFLPENRRSFNREDIPDKLFQLTNGWAWDKLFRTLFIRDKKLFFSGSRVANDGYFVYMAIALAGCITKIEDYLITQRVNNMDSLSNTRNYSWYCGIQMLYDIKDGLKKEELYKKLEITFLNFALKYLVWTLESLKERNIKKEIYRYIQYECEEKFGILRIGRESYYDKNQYELYAYIETHCFEEYLVEALRWKEQEYEKCQESARWLAEKLNHKIWPFPYDSVEKNSDIILYGAGKVGKDYFQQVISSDYCRVVLWIDQRFLIEKKKYPIQGWLDDLHKQKYDKVIIAIFCREDAEDAIALLKKHGVAENKIVWKMYMERELCL